MRSPPSSRTHCTCTWRGPRPLWSPCKSRICWARPFRSTCPGPIGNIRIGNAGCRPMSRIWRPGSTMFARREVKPMDRDSPPVLRQFFCLWLALLAAPALAATGVDAYGRLPSIEQAALSPDGTKIAFVKTTQDWRVLAIVDINEEKLVGGVRLGEVKLRSVEWADDDHLLLTTASSTMPTGLSGERT